MKLIEYGATVLMQMKPLIPSCYDGFDFDSWNSVTFRID